MNILPAISPVRGTAMTFQRERENTTHQFDSHTAIQTEKESENNEVAEKKKGG